jgi:LmbE family N-acetylglucosaminyl deacetylase
MPKRHRLAAIYAHPDDDTWMLAGTYLLHGDDLDLTVVVVSSGEAGMIADPSLATRENLAEVREAEERASLATAGQADAAVHFLRYPDGGVAEADRAELVDRLVAILKDARPDVVATFGPEGITQHEDHIAVSQATTEAFYKARDELGAGGPVDAAGEPLRRLFYSAVNETDLERLYAAMRAAGQEVDPDAPFMPRAVPDNALTVRVNTSSVADGKYESLMRHGTQEDEIHAFTDVDRELMLASERFVQAWPPVTDPDGPTAGSLFDGL